MKIVDWFHQHANLEQFVGSLLLILVLFLLRVQIVRHLKSNDSMSKDLKRRSMVHVRNGSIIVIFFGLVLIWASQIQVAAISVVAIAAAIVIATKELIMCFTGTVVRLTASSFAVGDRIEVNGIRGDVFDQTLLTTTLLEVGPGQLSHQHTGRVVVIPNSVFLTASVINDTFTGEYVLHIFMVPVKASEDWRLSRRLLLDAATRACEPFLAEARKHMENLSEDQGLYTPSVEPRITLQFAEPERVNLFVRIPVPTRKKGRIEQAILTDYAEQLLVHAPEKSSNEAANAAG